MKKIISFIASTMMTASSLTAVSSFALNAEETQNKLSVSKTVLSDDITTDNGTVIPAGVSAINVSISENTGFDSTMTKLELGNGYDIITDENGKPVISKGNVMEDSIIVPVSNENVIAVTSASADKTSDNGVMFTVFAYENPSADNSINIADSKIESSNYTAQNFVMPLSMNEEIEYVIGDAYGDGVIDSVDASQVLHAIDLNNGVAMRVTLANLHIDTYLPYALCAEAADTNKNKIISNEDAENILDYYGYLSSGKTQADYQKKTGLLIGTKDKVNI